MPRTRALSYRSQALRMECQFLFPPQEVATAAGLAELWQQVAGLRQQAREHHLELAEAQFVMAHSWNYVAAHLTIPYMTTLPDVAVVEILHALLPSAFQMVLNVMIHITCLSALICSAVNLSSPFLVFSVE